MKTWTQINSTALKTSDKCHTRQYIISGNNVDSVVYVDAPKHTHFFAGICKHYVSFFFFLKAWVSQSSGPVWNTPASPHSEQSGFCTLSDGTFLLIWEKSILTFSAERLITEFSNEPRIFRDEEQSCGQWSAFPQWEFFSASCQHVCSMKAALAWWLFP